ncbi:hypothetical protein G9A89_003897 [Geosiphon pyriformis]|nr:hypothetical protein G9A89_003897 [Geosiphon pyriformis]
MASSSSGSQVSNAGASTSTIINDLIAVESSVINWDDIIEKNAKTLIKSSHHLQVPFNIKYHNKPQDSLTNIKAIVTPKRLDAHFHLLERLSDLKLDCKEIDFRYLLRAQERYIAWLALLNKGKFPKKPPLPPIDVCLFWYAHCLTPNAYYDDIHRLYGRSAFEFNFPLEQLMEVSQNQDHIDEQSKQAWERYTQKPWYLDPFDDSDFEMDCPWCSKLLSIPADNYVRLMQELKYVEICSYCNEKLSIETLSAKRFLDDVAAWRASTETFHGGTLVDPNTGSYSPKAAEKDIDILFITSSTHISKLVTSLRQSSSTCDWPLIVQHLNLRIEELNVKSRLKSLRKGFLKRMLLAYIDIPFGFSIDLIEAVKKQREISRKILWDIKSSVYKNTEFLHSKGIQEYQAWFRSLKDNLIGEKFISTEMKLVLSTHMLMPSNYQELTNDLQQTYNQKISTGQDVKKKNSSPQLLNSQAIGSNQKKIEHAPKSEGGNLLVPSNTTLKKKPSRLALASTTIFNSLKLGKSKPEMKEIEILITDLTTNPSNLNVKSSKELNKKRSRSWSINERR